MLFQHHNDRRDARPEEDVRREPDNGVDLIPLDEILADHRLGLFLLDLAAEKDAMRQYYGHNAVWLHMVEVVKQKRIIRLALRRNAIVSVTNIMFVAGWIPLGGIRRIGHHRIDIQRRIDPILDHRPVIGQSVRIPRDDIRRIDPTHHQIHARQVVGVVLQLLRIVGDVVLVLDVLRNRPTDVQEERTRSARRVVDLQFFLLPMVIGDDLRHQQTNFMRSIELSGLLARIRGKLTDQIFIDEAQHIVVVASIRRHILDDIQQF